MDEIDPFDAAFADLVKEDAKNAGDKGVKHADAPNPSTTEPAKGPPVVAEGLAPLTEGAATGLAPIEEPPKTEIEGAPKTPEEQAAADAAAAEAAAAATAAAEAAKKPTPQVNDDQIARLADLITEKRAAPVLDAPAPKAPFSAEDMTFLNQYHADFGDVAKAESMLRRAEYAQLTTHIFQEVAKTFGPRMALLEQLADSAAYNALAAQVPEYDTNRDKVVDWIKTQPAYLQAGFNHVITHGTVEEIKDVFSRYSAATGQPAPAAAGAGGAPAPKAAELSSAVKDAAARLAPVTAKRSAPTQGVPQTFDDAFALYASAKA